MACPRHEMKFNLLTGQSGSFARNQNWGQNLWDIVPECRSSEPKTSKSRDSGRGKIIYQQSVNSDSQKGYRERLDMTTNLDGTTNGQNGEFSAIESSRRLVRSAQSAVMATVMPQNGAPFASLVTLATDPSGAPLLLLSDLAVHTRNIRRDSRVSLLIEERLDANPLACTRISMTGTIRQIPDSERLSARRRFLAKHPDAGVYCDFGDFSFHMIEIDQVHLVAGFGRIVDVAAGEILIECDDCSELLAIEEEAVAHLNADHQDALTLYAEKLAGMEPGDWMATGLDPDGLDLRSENTTCRIRFPEKVRGSGPLRAVMKRLAEQARML